MRIPPYSFDLDASPFILFIESKVESYFPLSAFSLLIRLESLPRLRIIEVKESLTILEVSPT